MLKKTLDSLLTPKESDELISAFDQVGNIIIVRIPDLLLPKKKLIGETLLEQVKNAKSVFYQSSSVEGEFRTRDLEILAGDDKTETEYKESGCRFIVDVRKAFFSPRLSSERMRIAELVSDGEVIVNMFGGIGMFSIIAAKKKKCSVYNIDINPDAANFCTIALPVPQPTPVITQTLSLNAISFFCLFRRILIEIAAKRDLAYDSVLFAFI